MRKQRILIVVNKNWECEPFMKAFKEYLCLKEPVVDLSIRDQSNYMASCRAEYHLKNYDVIIRCIQDLMDDPDKGKSNSQEKYRVLPGYIAADQPNLVISVSTAESTPTHNNRNGCVMVGGQFFMYDARDFNRDADSKLDIPQQGKIYQYDEKWFETFRSVEAEASKKFIRPPHKPANTMHTEAASNFGCVGVVNVEDYTKYEEADPAAYNAYIFSKTEYPPVSIETTHGIVRMSTPDEISVIFVSPIVDRYHQFAHDVRDSQNHDCAYNSGVVVSAFIRKLNQ